MTEIDRPSQTQQESLLRRRLRWLIRLRLLVSFLLIGGTMLLQAREPGELLRPPLVGSTAVLAAILLLSAAYWGMLPRVRNLQSLAYVQVVVDILLETGLVYLTGSEESLFASAYNFSIITGSVLLYRPGGLVAATLSSLLYGGMLTMRFFSLLPPAFRSFMRSPDHVGTEVFFTVLINVGAFFIVALLSSYLAEQARRSSKELEVTQSDLSRLTFLHQLILRCLPSGLLTCDSAGRVTYANQSAQDITGLASEELLGQQLGQIFPELPFPLLHEAAQGKQDAQMRRLAMRYARPDGRVLDLGFSLAPLRTSEGELMGTILHFQDLTETVAMERHLRMVDRLASIGEMAARIAHEIRNPLASVSGSIQILNKELSLEGPNRRLMEIVLRETNRLNGLITDFLSFAAPGQSRPEPMDLSAVLRETITLFLEQAKGSCQLKTQIPQGLLIEADSKRVRQIVWNLLNNALEAMPHGGELRVSAGWHCGPLPSGLRADVTWVNLEIEDSGTGIPEEVRDKVFDPFFTTKEKGTGLGLSIVHRLLEEMGGTVELQSQVGKGTRFKLWLPASPVVTQATAPRLGGAPATL